VVKHSIVLDNHDLTNRIEVFEDDSDDEYEPNLSQSESESSEELSSYEIVGQGNLDEEEEIISLQDVGDPMS
jgi:hypothetical protein